MQIGDLVRHQSIESLGIGIVTENMGAAHCYVLWSNVHSGSGHVNYLGSRQTLEVISKLETVNENR